MLSHLAKEQFSTQLTTHRPPQWCAYNPNVSHKLGLTASKSLALEKLHQEKCTAHLRSLYGARNQEISNQPTDGKLWLKLLLREHFSLVVFFCQQNCCYYYFILLCKIITTAFNLLPFVMLVLSHHWIVKDLKFSHLVLCYNQVKLNISCLSNRIKICLGGKNHKDLVLRKHT